MSSLVFPLVKLPDLRLTGPVVNVHGMSRRMLLAKPVYFHRLTSSQGFGPLNDFLETWRRAYHLLSCLTSHPERTEIQEGSPSTVANTEPNSYWKAHRHHSSLLPAECLAHALVLVPQRRYSLLTWPGGESLLHCWWATWLLTEEFCLCLPFPNKMKWSGWILTGEVRGEFCRAFSLQFCDWCPAPSPCYLSVEQELLGCPLPAWHHPRCRALSRGLWKTRCIQSLGAEP